MMEAMSRVKDAPTTPEAAEERWRAVVARDRRFDGRFVFGVRSTGIYCRPSCPARRPRPENVVFFPVPEAAEQAGFRSCRRCRPRETRSRDPQAAWVQRICRHIDRNPDEPLTLAALAAETGVSPHHLQRTFKRIMGITPRQYADARRLGTLKSQLKGGQSVALATYEAGYGSSSRLYERAPSQLGMTPGAYRRGGLGMSIGYTIADSPLGRLLVAATRRGVSAVCLGDSDGVLEAALRAEYPAAAIARDDGALGPWLKAILDHLRGREPHLDLAVDVQATAFQWRVWQELKAIPFGRTRSYGEIARRIGRPTAARAVARACATNPVALVVPCHRVIPEAGSVGGYRWGAERKRALLSREEAQAAGSRER
jgi:AraC family transcriptional regulator of adaptative response/methylated-DNA-[protein]-cysteine methyltransferase